MNRVIPVTLMAHAEAERAMKRLQVILAETGRVSRRGAAEWIREGRVAVDGEIVREPGLRVDPEAHRIALDDEPLPAPPPTATWMLNKPVGVTSTLADPHAERTLRELWGEEEERLGLRPVGRLDRDSRGLLLLSNDGELTHRLTHPRWRVEREYRAAVRGRVDEDALLTMRQGVVVEGRLAKAHRVEIENQTRDKTVLVFILKEGRKREVRRLCSAAGCRVTDLLRVRYGPVELGALKEGRMEPLAEDKLIRLYESVNLQPPLRGR